MHWHAHAVGCLAYSHDGRFLYSGGSEGVLVLWHLQTESKQFLPRLGSAIVSLAVSADGTMVAVGCASNTILVVEVATLRVVSSVRGVKPGAGISDLVGIGDGFHVLARPCVDNTIQFFDPVRDEHAGEVSLTRARRGHHPSQKREREGRVQLVRVSPGGTFMATLECVTTATGQHLESTLKFWRPAAGGIHDGYLLSMIVRDPHGRGVVVTGVEFAPACQSIGGGLCVSLGRDGSFIVWNSENPTSEEGGSAPSWACLSMGAWHTGVPAVSAAFSEDGSVLAIGHGVHVTLWDPISAVNLSVLTCPRTQGGEGGGDKAQGIDYLGSSGEFLAARCGGVVSLWSIVSTRMLWACASHEAPERLTGALCGDQMIVGRLRDGGESARLLVLDALGGGASAPTAVPLPVKGVKHLISSCSGLVAAECEDDYIVTVSTSSGERLPAAKSGKSERKARKRARKDRSVNAVLGPAPKKPATVPVPAPAPGAAALASSWPADIRSDLMPAPTVLVQSHLMALLHSHDV